MNETRSDNDLRERFAALREEGRRRPGAGHVSGCQRGGGSIAGSLQYGSRFPPRQP
jgi:hypothetical protein